MNFDNFQGYLISYNLTQPILLFRFLKICRLKLSTLVWCWIKINQIAYLNNFWCLINLNNGDSRKPKRGNFRHILFMTVQHKFYVMHQLKWSMTGHCTHKVSYSVKSRKTVSDQDIQCRGRLNNPLLFTRAYYFIRHSKNGSNPIAPSHLHCGCFGLCWTRR